MNIVLVGTNRGIGLEFCRQLSESGEHEIWAFCRQASAELKELESEKTHIFEGCDVTNLPSIETAAFKVEKPIDCFIHISGVLESESLDLMDFATIEKQWQVNTLGAIKSTLAFRPRFQKGTKLAFITSRMGSIEDNTTGGMYGYRMSKAALNMYGKSLAEDLKEEGVTVLLLHPGYVRTDMTAHNGEIDTQESVKGLLQIIDRATHADTGTFWHTNGERLPW